MASGLLQMRRVTGEDKVGWYMRCLSAVGDIDDVPRFANGEYNRGRAAMTAAERKLRGSADRRVANVSMGSGTRFDRSETQQTSIVASLSAEALSPLTELLVCCWAQANGR
jgi:hypothetical protein